jgi:hypothetical protein
MSEKINVAPKWDTTKNIENLTINPGYIYAFQDVLLYYINSVIPNPEDVGPIIRKCGDVISGKIPLEDAKFEWYEQHIYAIYSLLELLRYEATEQGLAIKDDRTIDKQDISDLTKALLDGNMKLVEELEKKITDDVNSQSA